MITDPNEKSAHRFEIYLLNSYLLIPKPSLLLKEAKNNLFIQKGDAMYTYELLETGCYYLIKDKEDSMITLIKVAMESDHCLFIVKYEDPTDTEWKMKKDALFDIIECLSDAAVKEWEIYYKSSEDAYTEEDDDD